MSFFGLFGQNRDTTAAQNPVINLPKPPPGLTRSFGSFDLPSLPSAGQTPPIVQDLPTPPPAVKKPSIWDDQHRKDTLLAISAGILSGDNFAEGMGGVARNLLAQRQGLRQEGRPVLGGPDDAFEIYTDPQTGERTYKPVKEFVDYQREKREGLKGKDTVDINSRYMNTLMSLPPEQQGQALAHMRQHPESYPGLDPRFLPETWDPTYGAIASGAGMTVSQARKRDQDALNGDRQEAHRNAVDEDRRRRTGIYEARSAAATAQGQARIGIASEALGLRKTGGRGLPGQAQPSQQSTTDLISFLRGN